MRNLPTIIYGTAIWAGDINLNDHHYIGRPTGGENEIKGYIWIRKIEGGWDDGYGVPVSVFYAIDGNVCCQYEGHSYYLEIEEADWPFTRPKEEEPCKD